MPHRPKIAVIGAGTGGLCLAQALHKAGLAVTVHERDAAPTGRGYLVSLNPHGTLALRDCLPTGLWQEFQAARAMCDSAFGFHDEQLAELMVADGWAGADADDVQHTIGLVDLHRLLRTGLDDVVRHGERFESYTRRADGRLECHFADGTTTVVDVLVGADGTGSRVRARYLPSARRVDTGIRSIAGNFPLTDGARAMLPPQLLAHSNAVLAPRGRGMYLGPHDRGPAHPGSHLQWALLVAGSRCPPDAELSAMTASAVQELAGDLTAGWHPALRRMIAGSESVGWLRIRTSTPVARWRPTNVTLIGDAIHSMTPCRGIGANTALRDAALLARNLISAAAVGADRTAAIGDYERQMTDYGFRAVRASLRAAREYVAEDRDSHSLSFTRRRFFPVPRGPRPFQY